MNVLIYGGGAVGLGLASFLIPAGLTVHLVGRKDTVAALNNEGLHRRGLFGECHAPPSAFRAHTAVAEIGGPAHDFILVCTKSYDTRRAAESLAAAPAVWSKRTRFVLCQNGWGNAEIFARRLPPSQIYNARVITGFCRPRPYQVEITVHADTVRMGSLLGGEPQALEPIAAALDRGGFPCQVTDSIGRDLWAKMLYNCMLNGLSTLFGVPYGVLGESPHASDLMDRLAGEVFGVMQAAGHVTHWANVEDYLAVFYGTQLPATYQHEPSMLQDVRAGKRTEVEALNGEIVRLGETLARPVPINHAVRQMIRFLEERNSWA